MSRVIPGRRPTRKWPPMSSAISCGCVPRDVRDVDVFDAGHERARQIGIEPAVERDAAADAVLVVLGVLPLEVVAGSQSARTACRTGTARATSPSSAGSACRGPASMRSSWPSPRKARP